MAKHVKQLGQVILYYRKDIPITLIDIYNGKTMSIFLNDNCNSWSEVFSVLEPYLNYYVVGEVTIFEEPKNVVLEVYISDIVP